VKVGADVAHPGPGVANRPSVASVVSSWDQYVSRYVAFSRVQHPRREIIENLKEMMMVWLAESYLYYLRTNTVWLHRLVWKPLAM
jgi:eukaryotic translation initiation factor 2C